MNEKLRILLVDDMKSIVREVSTALGLLSVKTKIDWKCPADPSIPFGCALPRNSELDKYDLALVDLELFPTKSSLYFEPDDLRGGTEVLPYLREEAPWLPVLAESRLYVKEAEHFLAVAGSFGFDGHIPRGLFRKGAIDRSLWESLISTAYDLRMKAVIGDKLWRNRQQLNIEASSEAELTLGALSRQWRELLSYVFCFNRKIVLDQLRGGFSGARVFRVYARSPFEHGGSEGEWLLKVSHSPSKLHQETQAHLNMLRGGLDFARMVPLLWPNVIVHRRVAAIAYQFASGTEEASQLSDTKSNRKSLCKRLNPLLKRFYRAPRSERSILGNLLSEWGPSSDTLRQIITLLPNCEIKGVLKRAAAQQATGPLAESLEYRRCLIHGDLHLGNIMLGNSDVLIDFARSADGPIAADAAKLVSDFLLRYSELRQDDLPTWDLRTGQIGEILEGLSDPFSLSNGDKKLFFLFLIVDLAVALQYEDVSKDVKLWIRSTLSKTKTIVPT
jgi:hypothetical protein